MGDQGLKVFISYARQDGSEFAKNLLAALEAAGFDPFIDQQDIAPGEPWEERLAKLLQQADTIVYVVTPAAVSSEHCIWEIEKAEALSKRLLPVIAIETPEAATPAKLRRLNYIHFTRGLFGEALKTLVDALRKDVDWIREHTRLSDLASRWDESGKSQERLLRGADVADAKEWLKAWKAPAPEPTELQRSFIAESERAEELRNSEERRRLQKLRRTTYFAIGAVAAFFLACVAGAILLVQQYQTQQALQAQLNGQELQLQAADAELEQARASLNDAVEQIAQLQQIGPQQSSVQTSAILREIESLRVWRVDVFWCETLGADGRARAENVARQLRAAEPSELGYRVDVRVRPLSAALNARPAYSAGNEIRPEASEREEGQALARFIANHGGPALTERVSRTATSDYLSVFLCRA